MRIGLVSTWGQRCGIATYSEQLAQALHKGGVEVVPFTPIEMGTTRSVAGFSPVGCWVRDDPGAGNAKGLVDAAKGAKVDLLHFQHEFGLFRNALGFLQTLKAIRASGFPCIVTLHTVPLFGHFWQRGGWLTKLRQYTDAIVVHTPASAASVSVAPGKSPVHLIPHGTPEERPGDAARGFKVLGLDTPDIGPLGLVFGFIGNSKNIVATVLAFGDGLTRGWIRGNAMLCIVGDSGGDTIYVERALKPAIDATGWNMNIRLIEKFVAPEEVPHMLAAAAFGVLNTTSWSLSASGQVHAYAAHGVPIAVADRPIYTEAVHAGAIPFTVGAAADQPTLDMIVAIAALARDQQLRATIRATMVKYAMETGWTRLVPRYVALYKGVANAPTAD